MSVMEKIIENLFDINKISTKFISVIWLSTGLILFFPEQFLFKLTLTEFIEVHGKYIGISFLICSSFLIVVFIQFLSKTFNRKRLNRHIRKGILTTISELDFHEKAVLREFFINDKNTLQLPIDNDTVVGLVSKRILYQVSKTGFTYIHGAYFPYSISDYVRENLKWEMIDLPQNPTDEDKERIINNRPYWAKEKSRRENW